MVLTCRPPGRGNWAPVIIEVRGRLAELDFFRFYIGQIIELGENRMRLRVVSVLP